MKKSIFISMLFLLVGGMAAKAQGGGFQMPSPEERVKRVHFKIDSAFSPEATVMKEIDALFLEFYKTQDKVREDLRNSGVEFQEMRTQMTEKMKPHQEALDAKLKTMLGEDKFKIWKEQIEPTLRGRGGPPRNN
jgi:hypothetical protein